MKRIITCFAILVATILSAFAQIPQTFSYQAVVRDNNNRLVVEQPMEVYVQILQGSDDGFVVYSEKHYTGTNQNGLMTFELGGGETTNNFASIDWSNAPYFVRTIISFDDVIIHSVTPLLAVPYALYAAKAGNAERVDIDLSDYAKKTDIPAPVDLSGYAKSSDIESNYAKKSDIDAISTKISDTLQYIASTYSEKKEMAEYYTKAQVNAMLESFLMKFGVDDGSIHAKFSIADNKYVYFSKGNLQYRASTNTWRFAENQWDYVGTQHGNVSWVNGGTVVGSDNSDISSSYSGWIDLFGYGTSGYIEKPYNTSKSINNYRQWHIAGTNSDWGGFNVFSNAIGPWRTLTNKEWDYLINRHSGLLYGVASVNDVIGLVLLPDEWDLSASNFISQAEDWTSNVYSLQEWEEMQSLGAVFLPAAGYRKGTEVGRNFYDDFELREGFYWSSTGLDSPTFRPYQFRFASYARAHGGHFIEKTYFTDAYYGLSVRLVRDAD